MFTSVSRSSITCTLFLALSVLSLQATQIIWQSSRAAHETSTGQAFDHNYIFELGIFTEPFVPTPFNVNEWATNWQAADRVRFDATNQAFTSRIDVEENDAPFLPGKRGYIWGYGSQSNEWILMSSPGWNWPSSGGIGFPLEWTTRTATEVIVGSLPTGPGEPHLRTANVGSHPLPSLTKTGWLNTVFTAAQRGNAAISAWSADPDHDGRSNLVEYAVGGNPLMFEPNLGLTVTIQLAGDEPDFVDLRLARTADRLATTQIELSTDLKQWNEAGDAILEDQPGLQHVRLPWSTIQRQFVRIQVTEH